MFKKKQKAELPYHVLTTRQLIKRYLISKLPPIKKSAEDFKKPLDKLPIPESEITHLAIVLNGEVQDIMRAQDRFAALLLSGPDFVEFHPGHEQIIVGKTRYVDGDFINDEES